LRAYRSGQVDLQAKVQVRIAESFINEGGEQEAKVTRYETTIGRAILSELLPVNLSFSVVNKTLKRKRFHV